MSEQTPEQQVGDLAARALDQIGGRNLVGAVLVLAVASGDDDELTATSWFVPDRQPWQLTLGMVEDWRITQAALITESAVKREDTDDEDE
jgi:hypothetical protein